MKNLGVSKEVLGLLKLSLSLTNSIIDKEYDNVDCDTGFSKEAKKAFRDIEKIKNKMRPIIINLNN